MLRVIKHDKLQINALKVGTSLMRGLEVLQRKHMIIGDMRGLGLFIGVELVLNRATLAPASKEATWIVNQLKERKKNSRFPMVTMSGTTC